MFNSLILKRLKCTLALCPHGGIGRHNRLKICRPLAVPVRVWLRAPLILNFFFFLAIINLSACTRTPATFHGLSEPVIQSYLNMAQENCQRFSRINQVNFQYTQAVKRIQYCKHNFEYYIIDGRFLRCDDCPSCYHTDNGYDLKVFVREGGGPLLLAFNRIVLRYELLDPDGENAASILKVVVQGAPRPQKDAIYLKYDGRQYQAVSRDPDVR